MERHLLIIHAARIQSGNKALFTGLQWIYHIVLDYSLKLVLSPEKFQHRLVSPEKFTNFCDQLMAVDLRTFPSIENHR